MTPLNENAPAAGGGAGRGAEIGYGTHGTADERINQAYESETLTAALAMAERGVPIFPCGPDKRPLTPHGFKAATTAPAQIRAWWGQWPDALIGRPTGAMTRVVVLDVDQDGIKGKDGGTSLAELEAQHGPLPDTWEVLTPSGGRHLYFRHPGPRVPCSASKVGADLDIRGDGGYVIVPPSRLADRREYRWEGSSDPSEGAALADIPGWLLALAVGPSTREEPAQDGAAGADNPIPEGKRNAHLASLAGTMRRRGMTESAILAALMAENAARCVPALSDEDVQKIARSIGRYSLGPALADPWPDPMPLPQGLPPVDPFAVELLPAALRPWVADIADRMQCPLDYPAVGAMICLGAVVGRQIAIRPKRQDDWTVVPNLWGAVVGRPALLKTPSLQEPMRMLERLEIAAGIDHKEDMRAHKAKQMVAAEASKQTQREIAQALKSGGDALNLAYAAVTAGDDEEPRRRRYLTSDATVEKIGELLRDNPRGMLVFRDELSGWLQSLDREGREGTRAFYLEAWNGTGRFTFDRIGRGTIEIEAACLSVLGGIQPGPLGAYLSEALGSGAGDDGLIQRLQLLVWPDAPRTWRNVDRWPNTPAKQAVWEMFSRFDTLDTALLGASGNIEEGDIPYLRFDHAAQDEFDAWRSDLEARLRAGDLHPAMEAHLAKYRSLVPSLALLIHLADCPEGGPVSHRALLQACAWGEYLETHARRLYSQALAPEMAAAVELDRRLSELPDPFTAKDVYRNHWRLLDLDGTSKALRVLADFGRIRGRDRPGIGRPTVEYQTHPALRGRQEAAA